MKVLIWMVAQKYIALLENWHDFGQTEVSFFQQKYFFGPTTVTKDGGPKILRAACTDNDILPFAFHLWHVELNYSSFLEDRNVNPISTGVFGSTFTRGAYIQKGGFCGCRTPQTIWIFRRKIVWERENYQDSVKHCLQSYWLSFPPNDVQSLINCQLID